MRSALNPQHSTSGLSVRISSSMCFHREVTLDCVRKMTIKKSFSVMPQSTPVLRTRGREPVVNFVARRKGSLDASYPTTLALRSQVQDLKVGNKKFRVLHEKSPAGFSKW